MLELARLLLDFRLAVERKTVGKQSLGESVTPDDVSCPMASAIREVDHETTVANGNTRRLQRVVAWIHEWFVVLGLGRMRHGRNQPHLAHLFNRQADRQGSMNFHVLDLSN